MPYTRTNNYAKPAAAQQQLKSEGDVEMSDPTAPTNGAETQKAVPAWLSKIKEGGVKKVSKEVQRRRRNYRLKKMLSPKPPMMVLFELVKPNEIQFENFISDPMTRLVKACASYNGQKYEGIGPSKAIAKNICCEQIIQHIAFSECTAQSNDLPTTGVMGEDTTPWTALASVALFKLFNDWQAQGVTIPTELMKQNQQKGSEQQQAKPMEGVSVKNEPGDEAMMTGPGQVRLPDQPKRRNGPKQPKTLPEQPLLRHPVQLLNEMEGQLVYETAMEGIPPNVLFTTSVIVKEQKFSGTSKNKKEAKKAAAQEAMAALYNVIYPPV